MDVGEFLQQLFGEEALGPQGITLPVYRNAVAFLLSGGQLPPEMQDQVTAYREILTVWEENPTLPLRDVILEHARQKALSNAAK